MTLSDLFLLFREDYIWMHGYSRSTEDNYDRATRTFVKFVGDKQLMDLGIDDVKLWRRKAEADMFERNSIRSYLYIYRNLFRYALRKGLIDFDPEMVILPRPKRSLPRYLTFAELQRLYEAGDLRERAIVALLYSTGMRVGELVRVRQKDLQDGQIIVRSKGDIERRVFLDSTAQSALAAYLATRTDNNPFLLYTAQLRQMSRGTVQVLVRQLGVKAHLNKRVYPHLLRHTLATHLLQDGCNLRYIQEILGHADISTTQIYTHVADGDLAKAYSEHHKALAFRA